MVHILVVDDDPKLNKAVCTYLNDLRFYGERDAERTGSLR